MGDDVENNDTEKTTDVADTSEETANHPPNVVSPTDPYREPIRNSQDRVPASSSSTYGKSAQPAFSKTTVDERTGLRIVKRRTSRFDLVDLLVPLEFHTANTLSAMSVNTLGTLITVPSKENPNNPTGFTGGKTNLATMGVVFKNSGTKISANSGRAYSILSVGGTIGTGATISVFLFGEAYSKHTSRIPANNMTVGSVVAILCPTIMPSLNGKQQSSSATCLSMSLNDARQIVLVGMAQDFGVCAGMNRSKRDGRFCECRCEHPVDLRMGNYCKTHQKQQFQKEGGNGASKKSNATFMQQLRTENTPATNNTVKRGQIVQNKQGVYVNTATTNASLQRRNNVQRGGFGGSITGSSLTTLTPGTMTMSTPAGTVITHVQKKNGSQQLQTPQRSNSLRAPLHMTKQANKSSVTMTDRNPYKKAGSRDPSRGMLLSTTKLQSVQKGRNSTQVNVSDLLGSAISGSGKRKSMTPKDKSRGIASIAGSSSEKKKRRVAHLEGFDGAVFVPKPNTLFRKSQLSGGPNICDSTNSFTAQDSSEQTKERLIEHQRMVAERIRQKSGGAIGNAARTPLSKLTNRTTNQGHNKQQNSVTKERKSGLDSIIGTFEESEKNK
eukprot:scaffold137101_cov54-Attheya_sp.AAC.4